MSQKKELTFDRLITDRLNELGWTYTVLAERAGLSKAHIGNLAKGVAPGTKEGKPKRTPPETVDKIADALKVPREIARRAAGLAGEPFKPFDEMDELVFMMGSLPPARRADAMEIVRTMYWRHGVKRKPLRDKPPNTLKRKKEHPGYEGNGR
jgi:transcriptional regulator with XRE-family HTH domain